MQPAPAGRVLKAYADELTEVDVEGHHAWMLTKDLTALRKARGRVPARLLAGFDVYVVGTRSRSSLVEERFESLIFRQAGWISPVMLIDGRAQGVWKHERTGGNIDVTITPFGKIGSARRKEIVEEADRLGKFLGSPARVSFSSPARV